MKRSFLLMAVSFMAMTSAFASIKDAYQIIASSAAGAKAGRQVTVSLNLKNKEAISSWQCDLVLPAGVELVKGSAKVSTGRCGEAYSTIEVKENGNGSYTLACGPTSDATISGNDGEVATVVLYVKRDVAPGQVSVKINNIVMTEANATPHQYETTEYLMPVATQDYIVGNVDKQGAVDGTDIVSLVNFVIGAPNAEHDADAADVNEDGTIDGSDIVALVNIVAGA